MDATRGLAEWAAELTYDRLTPGAVEALKRSVLDTLGTALAATTLGEGSRAVVEVARAGGGAPEATILGFGERAPAVMAALANGSLAHDLNYDDQLPASGTHVGVTAIPAALALAERRGGVDGRTFLTALAAGAEVTARIGLALAGGRTGGFDSEAHPQPTQFLGYFTAAAAAARVLGLNAAATHSALGLAYMQASGGRQPVVEGNAAKAVYAAFPNQDGVLSALLAQQGLEAECEALEGEAGLFATFYEGRYAKDALAAGLDETFYVEDLRFKPWPTSGIAHPFIEGALRLAAEHQLAWEQIDAVVVRGSEHLRTFSEPVEARRRPANPATAANSVFFAVAKALVNGEVALSDFTAEGLRQPETLRFADRITYEIDPRLGSAGVVEITLQSGERVSTRIDAPLGHPPRPMTYDRLVEKFRDCARYAVTPVPRASLDEAIRLIAGLEQVQDVAVLPRLLSAATGVDASRDPRRRLNDAGSE